MNLLQREAELREILTNQGGREELLAILGSVASFEGEGLLLVETILDSECFSNKILESGGQRLEDSGGTESSGA